MDEASLAVGQGWRIVALACVLKVASRGLMLRDRLLGTMRGVREPRGRDDFFFESGGRRLHGSYAAGGGAEARDGAAMLLCHGIGETVEHWRGVQAVLQEGGVGSMVFDYSGYAKSEGWITPRNLDEDLAAAYAELGRRAGAGCRLYVLGFSMGSGVAAAGAGRLVPQPDGLFLCEAFTSLRDASACAGWPGGMRWMVPDVWDTVRAVCRARVPVWVVHSLEDRLFPKRMAEEIVLACGGRGELMVARGEHNALYLPGGEGYWAAVLEVVRRSS